MQIGWANSHFQLSADSTDGIGDDAHSYSFDGARQMKWNGTNEVYGSSWEPGSIVGCELYLSGGVATISYSLNGLFFGNAFVIDRLSEVDSFVSYYPALSVEEGEKLTINIGHRPFRHQPEGSKAVKLHIEGDTEEVVSGEVKVSVDEETFQSIDLESVLASSKLNSLVILM
jgi:hypothetical protein